MVEDDILAEEDVAVLDKPSDLIILKRLQLQLAQADNEKLRLQLSQGSSTSEPPFCLSDALKFVPLFPEEDSDGFFISFERAAALYEWPEDKCVLLAHNSFRGKAQDVFRSLDSTITNDYHVVKKSILHAYQKVPEAYRQQFRSCRKAEGETSHLEERGINSLEETGPSADHYALINPDLAPKNKLHVLPPYPPKQMSVAPVRPPLFRDTRDSHFVRPLVPVRPAGGVPHQNVGRELRPPPYCRYCKNPGHQIHECMKLASKNTSSPHGRVVLHTSVRPDEVELPQIPQVSEKLDLSPCLVTVPSNIPPSFQPFCSSGRVAASCTVNFSSPVTILRDTGSDLSCILKEDVANFECYTGETVLVSGLPGTAQYPLCSVYLTSAFVTRQVTLAIVDTLPVPKVSILIGHDLAPNPIVVDVPSIVNNTSKVEKQYPNLFPNCAVTRSQSKRLAEAPSEETNDPTDDLFLGELFNDAIPAPLPTETHSNALPTTREALIQQQSRDPELQKFFNNLTEEGETTLRTALKVAHSHLGQAQERMKLNYDKRYKVQIRTFKTGDSVLALLPLPNHPLQSKFYGPYTVLERAGDLNYVIATPDRRKKIRTKLANSQILADLSHKVMHLPPSQAGDITFLLQEFQDVCGDVPQLCPLLHHDVDVQGAKPIRQTPYRLGPEKRELLQEEVGRADWCPSLPG
ncbi:hypothetical protein Pmani_000446 [Petrolisthes manimaculis]|uniref:Uncharacterized protein n=1 Tax=Petrolisthes manimaculis TaxID=1843537 RepID=A0AAE1QPA3_9EUCA|nr:hypothetical protein Pmani_000446 [Petrolisthes manimaculis]